jgi:tetratricopeptide (TPR) repeat protein
MRDAHVKATLLDLLRLARAAEEALVAGLTDAERAEVGTLEHWSAKDVIAHLAAWKRQRAREYAAAARGEDVTISDEFDADNARIFAENAGKSWGAVLEDADRALDDLLASVDALSEDDLTDPQRFSWRQGHPLAELVLGNGLWHPYAHMIAYYRDRGQTEQASRMMEELVAVVEQMDAPATIRGGAVYNLACAYALAGQRAEALALLPEAFDLEPGLKALAREDTDLDSLRGDSAFAALLAE